MAYSFVQGGTTLYRLSNAGVATALTLPSDVALSATGIARFRSLLRNTIMVGSPSRSIFIDKNSTVHYLSLTPPSQTPTLTAGTGTGLTGAYRVAVTYAVKDAYSGALISESDLGPVSAAFTAANQSLSVTNIPISQEAEVNSRRLYRTTAGGAVYFHWLDLDDNVATSVDNNIGDAGLALLPITNMGSAPRILTVAASWKERMWAAGDPTNVDNLYFSDSKRIYAWPAVNVFSIPPIGKDQFGIVGLAPRRDELGVFRRDVLWKVSGSSTSDFRVTKIVDGVGCISPDTIVIIRDIAYFLGFDGVYRWGPTGVERISTFKDVHKWFTTDDYFARSQFPNAFARWNQKYDTYDLYLVDINTQNPRGADRWVSYDLIREKWLGPHTIGAATPTCAAQLQDNADVFTPVIGLLEGSVLKSNFPTFSDNGTAIAFQVDSKFHSMDTPDIMKYFGQLSVISKIQASGTATITPYVGGLNASAGTTISHDLTTGRQRLARLGSGRYVKLSFANSVNNIGCELYGYEIGFHELGRR